jgi:hypothetical protein
VKNKANVIRLCYFFLLDVRYLLKIWVEFVWKAFGLDCPFDKAFIGAGQKKRLPRNARQTHQNKTKNQL